MTFVSKHLSAAARRFKRLLGLQEDDMTRIDIEIITESAGVGSLLGPDDGWSRREAPGAASSLAAFPKLSQARGKRKSR